MLLKFIDRLQVAACPYIDLTDQENKLYRGCGWAIATVEDGQIIALKYLYDLTLTEAQEITKTLDKNSNYWLGMCSGHQFCEPRRIHMNDPASIPRLLRLVAEMEI